MAVDAKPVRVLLVDDDEDIYVLICSFFSDIRSMAFHVDWVSDYSSALTTLNEARHDVCLLDYRLGAETGMDVLREAMKHGCKIPLIFLTGQGDRELDLEAMKAGAADYLVKSDIAPPLLERSIRYAIERAHTLDALRESEERYALAVNGANDGIYDWNLQTDVVYYSSRWKSMLGYDERDLTTSSEEWFSRVHPDDTEQLKRDIASHLESERPHFENEHRMRLKDGSYRWMLSRGIAVRDTAGKPYRMAGSQTDITDRKLAEQRLLHDALHDPLTGLPNRALFSDRLKHSIICAKRRPEYMFAVLFIDLDRFKVINDSLGHLVGDQLLISIARRLETCLRPGDTVARLGGDEFTILLEDIKEAPVATRIADRVLEQLAVPFHLSGHEIFTTGSIGITLGSGSYESPAELLRDADTAMYRAKAGGRARTEMFKKDMHADAVSLLKTETDLRRALDREEFEVYYQPIISLAGGETVGFEALIRWNHPDRGLLYPAEFIHVAEETGLIHAVGKYVLRQACQQACRWQEICHADPPMSVSVNLSAKQVQQLDFVEQVLQVLDETGILPCQLQFEVAESAVIHDTEASVRVFDALRKAGIGLHIDDFGTGYSALTYLHRFPIDALKIDQSFIAAIGSGSEKAEIVKTILALTHNLKIPAVAEGVERPDQLDLLRLLNCERAQGYLFHRPMRAPDTEEFLAKTKRAS